MGKGQLPLPIPGGLRVTGTHGFAHPALVLCFLEIA